MGGPALASDRFRTLGADQFADLEHLDPVAVAEDDEADPVILRKTRRALTRAANPRRGPLETMQAQASRAGSDSVGQESDADRAGEQGAGAAEDWGSPIAAGGVERDDHDDHVAQHSDVNNVEPHALDMERHVPELASASSEYLHRDACLDADNPSHKAQDSSCLPDRLMSCAPHSAGFDADIASHNSYPTSKMASDAMCDSCPPSSEVISGIFPVHKQFSSVPAEGARIGGPGEAPGGGVEVGRLGLDEQVAAFCVATGGGAGCVVAALSAKARCFALGVTRMVCVLCVCVCVCVCVRQTQDLWV